MVRITQFRILAAALSMLSCTSSYAADKHSGIEIGIAPFLSLKTLVQNYAPLREYLEIELKEPVTIVSAPDYKTFYLRIRKRVYPIIITPANSAYLAWSESAYTPLFKPLIDTRPALVVAKDQPITQISELRGKKIAMSDALAIVSMQGLHMLREAGLEPEQDITIKNMQNHSVAVNMLLAGEVDAALVSDRALLQMPQTIKDKIKVVLTWEKGAAPGLVYMSSPDIPQKRQEQISNAIYKFARDTPEGIKLFKDMGYGGLTPIEAEELKSLTPYGLLLKEAISKN